ncbi:MAG: hypothetical protein WB987_15795 [Candidatus Acidiferrales bacterium]
MAGQHTLSQHRKSIAGASLIALGLLLLCANLTPFAAQLSRSLGLNAADARSLGLLAVIALGASHTLRVYLFNQQDFLQTFHQLLISLWPLLFVGAGTALLRDGFTDNDFAGGAEKRKNNSSNVSISQPVVRR